MSERNKSLLVVKTSEPLTEDQLDDLTAIAQKMGESIGAEVCVTSDGMDVALHPADLSDLIAAIKAQTKSNLDLAAAIRIQANAIAGLTDSGVIDDAEDYGSILQTLDGR